MMKNAFYFFMRHYMDLVRMLFFWRPEIIGRKGLPLGNPIIYSCNHQNSFMDALLIGATSPVKITSLTRSDVFGSHAGMWFMTALQMQPIYRMQDGYDKLAKNEEVFEVVRNRLRKNEGILIFSEANHSNEYPLRNLSKGSSRMSLESQEAMPDRDVYVVPIGINYYHHQRPFHKLSIVYGTPIRVRDYLESYDEHPAKAINQLKSDISAGMRECMILPDNDEDYEKRKILINRRNENMPYAEFRNKLLNDNGLKNPAKPVPVLLALGRLLGIFNFLPLWILQRVLSPIKDIVFYGSMKWVSALFIIPFWWILLFVVTTVIWDWRIGLLCFGVSFVMLIIRQWLIRLSNVSH